MKLSCLYSGTIWGLWLIASAPAAETNDAKMNDERAIPLSEIVTTSPQKGLQHVRDAWRQKNKKQSPEVFLQQMHKVTVGGSNVFLVDATNLHDALSASLSALTGRRSADTPAPLNAPNPNRGSLWLVVYLGSGPSDPTWWTVESVKIKNDKVLFGYRPSKPSPATGDVHLYYYWIPLGTLAPGAYELQLVNLDENKVRLMRRVDAGGTE